MAAKKKNKTEHVLNIISGHTEPESAAASEVEKTAQAPIVDMARSEEDTLAEKIHDSLAQELGDALAQEETPVADVSAEPAPVAEPAPPAEAAPAAPAPAEPAPVLPKVEERGDDWVYVNIMQQLVEGKAESVMKSFNLCTCPRCKADVKAIALSSLPAKYAVTQTSNAIPLLTVYEGRYSAELTTQLMNACARVAENPRHSVGSSPRLMRKASDE